MFDHDRLVSVKNCFDTRGRLKFDPYRTDRINEVYRIIFDDDGFIHTDIIEIVNYLADHHNWSDDCDARALKFIQRLGNATKGSYPPVYYWR